MLDPKLQELRQIKRILLGILACLVFIVLAVAPDWISIALIVVGLYAILMLVLTAFQTARRAVSGMWWEVCSLWRRS
jgi:hypothetical protein